MSLYLNGRVELALADITTLSVDAIVNAANESLLGGGGVDGAIHSAAGPELADECRGLGGANPGESKLTLGYNLPAGYVIHTVGPRWRGGDENEPFMLASCYLTSLMLLVREGLTTIAFPAISTGVFGYPIEPATTIAMQTVRATLDEQDTIERVIFCCYSGSDLVVYKRLAEELLG